jgi:predicted kinase
LASPQAGGLFLLEASVGSIILLEGPVGAGKSTYAAELVAHKRAPHFNLDDWFVTLYSPDRPQEGLMLWYSERKRRCIEQIWKATTEVLKSGVDVILELGLLTRIERQAFYQRCDGAGVSLAVTMLLAPRDVRRERVRQRNRERGDTFRMEVPDAFFELASDRWEEPDEFEVQQRQVRIIETSQR